MRQFAIATYKSEKVFRTTADEAAFGEDCYCDASCYEYEEALEDVCNGFTLLYVALRNPGDHGERSFGAVP